MQKQQSCFCISNLTDIIPAFAGICLFKFASAEFKLLKSDKGFAPLLLLDDVFEKLDESRMHNLLDWVCVQNDGQIFITDTHRERIIDHFEKLGAEFQIVDL